MVAANDRVPCPQCGGLIHPISGRCKHCKADLATARGARSSAPVALPALVATPVPGTVVATPAAAASPWAPPGRQAYSPVPSGAPIGPLAGDDSQPILPPRVTARQHAVAAPSDRAWWKSWPILVIIAASLAIVVAIILLVLPGDHRGGGKKDLNLGPAPDRMDTDPTVPGANGLPQQDNQAGSGKSGKADPDHATPPNTDPTDPNATPHTRPAPPDPLPPDPPADPDDDLGLGGILGGGSAAGGGNPLGGLGGIGSPGMMSAMMQHGCARVNTCSATNAMVKQACDQIGPMLSKLPKALPSCAAAQRCLDKIDTLDCDTKIDDLTAILSLQTKIGDCVDALQCT